MSIKLKALIVDDEHSGRTSLKILLNKYYYYLFEEIYTSSSLEDAISTLSKQSFDICFLDIELNTKSGFDLLPYLQPNTTVIFVTAFSEYAIAAIKGKAFDYLLKPINPIELKKSINRYKKEFLEEKDVKKNLLIKVNGLTNPLPINEIEYIQARGAYSKIVMLDKKEYITAKTLKKIIVLIGHDFIRIHKSYIINKMMIKSFKKETLTTTQNTCLPISRIGTKELSRHF